MFTHHSEKLKALRSTQQFVDRRFGVGTATVTIRCDGNVRLTIDDSNENGQRAAAFAKQILGNSDPAPVDLRQKMTIQT